MLTTGDTTSPDREIFEDDAQTGLASSESVVSKEDSNYTTGQPPFLATTQTDAGAIRSTPYENNHGSSPSAKKPKNPVDGRRSKTKRRSEVLQEPATPTSNADPSSSSTTDSVSSAASPVGPREKVLQDLQKEQEGVARNPDGFPRFPKPNDFPGLHLRILEPIIDVDVRNCVIILHDYSKRALLHRLALRLQKDLPESVFILIKILQTSSTDTDRNRSAYESEADDSGFDTTLLKESRTILVDVVKNVLVAQCRFPPRNIIILGHRQGGTAALVAATLWEETEFGGVISADGALPAFTRQITTTKAKTPALLLSGALGNSNDAALRQIREQFSFVESEILRTSNDDIPESEDIGILLSFFAHRLNREEWTKQAVISFDGGGIRGYGSLLILRALMNKIGEEEKRLDPTIQSSFAPYDYKPMPSKGFGGLDDADVDGVVSTATQGLPDSSLFLPCHYFTYAAGTSTGGLISIMLSRFRMTVDDCIKEYKTLGAKVFGNPRPLAKGAILWHKFDCDTLKDAVIDVTQRYSELGEFGGSYAMDEDVCRSMVLAYADSVGADHAYRFRTYQTQKPLQRAKSTRRSRTTGTYGNAVNLPIWQVARATSAAPTYFRPIEIERGNLPEVVTFKDGGFGSNNPSEEMYNDIIEKHGGKVQNMGPFISIGTGIPPIKLFAKRKGNISNAWTNLKAATKLPSRTIGVHERMEGFSFVDNKERFPYFRFDGGERLGGIALDEWKSHRLTWLTGKDKNPGCITLEEMYVATAAYLAEPKVQQDLTECARILVRRRQLRARDTSEWDRYASFSYYDCNVEGCDRPRISKAHDFKEHLRKFHHKIADRETEQRVQECRRVYWKYRPGSADPTPPAG